MNTISFEEYQSRTSSTAMYPEELALPYLALGVASEGGEVAGKVKKIIRDKAGAVDEEAKDQLVAELGDVLWYVAQMSNHLGVDMSEIAEANLTKLSKRKANNTIQGEGDNR